MGRSLDAPGREAVELLLAEVERLKCEVNRRDRVLEAFRGYVACVGWLKDVDVLDSNSVGGGLERMALANSVRVMYEVLGR